MRILFLIISFMFCIGTTAQTKKMSKMSQTQKKEYLVKIAAKVTKTFGPGYYRENMKSKLTITEGIFESADERPEVQKNVGRKFYIVTFPYDKSKETLDFDFSSSVKIWENTGEPLEVIFGNGQGKNFIFLSYKEQIDSRSIIETVPYEQAQLHEGKFIEN
ncbi:MAG: hypothetical protein RR331_08575 [Bacteroides sp.]